MISNLDKYKKDLDTLIDNGVDLLNAMQYECQPDEFETQAKKIIKDKDKYDKFVKTLPKFNEGYQQWYSESLIVIKLLLPGRLGDFIRLFEKPKTQRKAISYENYVVEDYLQGLVVTRGYDRIVEASAAIPKYNQQLNILKSVKKRFESSLFDIEQLVQADLFDSELEASVELNKNGFGRAAGAIAGVVLESHLLQVCKNHNLEVSKATTISTLNDLLKENNIYDVPVWRQVQYLGDLRNKCDHKKTTDPTREEIQGLIDGIEKITKTIF